MKKSLPKSAVDLSIIILNYNSGNYLSDCLQSLKDSNLLSYRVEFIVVDNTSTDNSIALSKSRFLPNTKYQILNTNLGFSAGNNQGIKLISPNSRYVLFLNPDTIVNPDTLAGMIKYLDNHQYIDAATCNVILAKTGRTQPESHRDFPTPLNALLHFSGISSRQYFMENLDYSREQKINACAGAFLMVKRKAGESIGWWNEKYFFYGEDLDFCYQLKKHNFSLYFIPDYQITHFQGVSSGIKETRSKASRQTRIRSAIASTQAMKIFYENNLFENYPLFTRYLVALGINLLQFTRVLKAKYL